MIKEELENFINKMIVFIDTSILGLLCNPNGNPEAKKCNEWLLKLLCKSVRVVTSVICEYETKRSLILARMENKSSEGIEVLDKFKEEGVIEFLPVTEEVANIAADNWADAEKKGQPTADAKDINIDMIICGHWRALKNKYPGRYIVIATTNIGHLQRYAEAELWENIN